MSLKVLQPGLLTTIQDTGRSGVQHMGLSPSGAMDYFSFMVGNQLLENNEFVSLEMTMQGGTFEFGRGNSFIITGADMQATLNDKPVNVNTIYHAKMNDQLKFSAAVDGMRTYLTVRNGFHVESVFDSYSTHTKIKLGGKDGRALQAGDELPFKDPEKVLEKTIYTPPFDDKKIRFIPGQQFERFERFKVKTYEISNVSDRMGIRLEGDALKADDYDILSEPVQLGSIQVSASGQPIVLLNDRQTVGGYAKIGTVYFNDLPKLVQKKPGEIIELVPGTFEEAVEEKRKMMKYIEDINILAYKGRTSGNKIKQLIKRVK
ncbi:biotin-dependent carboxyltransferase family protein [Macrococcus hajekii]|uniref:Biotin-dependent carboxyltransferase family protein n=1 Tax=Macrococcus hajekii TaxID=198482 RepID=A0A4R6BHM6_9STAP|nr:biotin-dependent carboxyltransferase family protein [Macrococcus hajekii]TDM01087.1 biotin-dependent carboxyltransferase family protein [Macrococcus hajekii]GGB12508.1 allophanate hydrolase [Macrococcus hajekii]